MIGLVCMLDGKGMKKGSSSIKSLDFEKIRFAALFNLEYTRECIKFCIENKYIYRVSSSIIPYPDFWKWEEDSEIKKLCGEIKELSKNIRLIIHPDQFVVLNSDSESVIENSLVILAQQAALAKLLGVESLILHIGKMNGAEKFKQTYSRLDDYTKSILVLENCHYYKVNEVLELCKELKLPAVLDVHHARITSSTYDYKEIIKTWEGRKPLAHISTGKSERLDKSHSDYISREDLKEFSWLFLNFDVEIEAKKKEKALEEVRKDLKELRIEV